MGIKKMLLIMYIDTILQYLWLESKIEIDFCGTDLQKKLDTV